MSLWIWEVYWLLSDEFVHFEIIIASSVKGRKSNDHLVGQNTKSPPIDWETMTFFIEDFRSKIFGSSAERVGLGVALENFSETEVG